MMTRKECAAKADMCEARAIDSPDQIHGDYWREMATQWRGLAGDANCQATLARLMNVSQNI